jgi:hypothetical protein
MNRDWVLSHLREAHEELQRTIAEIESKADYSHGEFLVAMTHAYHHLNTAWNAKDEYQDRLDSCVEADFHRWRGFPPDLDGVLGE